MKTLARLVVAATAAGEEQRGRDERADDCA